MLLTRLPVPRALHLQAAPDAALLANSALFYPLVGAGLGLLLWGLGSLSVELLAPLASAAIVLAAWVYLTGALHLDGLADCIDGLAAAHRDPSRLREAMKDSHIGAMGAVALCLALILKCALLATLLELGAGAALVWILVLARLAALICIHVTPYCEVGGPAAAAGGAHRTCLAWAIVFTLGAGFSMSWGVTALLWIGGGLWFWYWRRLWHKALGGYSGDMLGGLIETVEIVLLGIICVAW